MVSDWERRERHEKIINVVMGTAVAALALGFLVFAGAAAVDGIQSVRAQDEEIACEARQGSPRRYIFTDSVVCVPVPTRQDTLTVRR